MQFNEDSSIYNVEVTVSIFRVTQSYIVNTKQEDIQLSFLSLS